MNDLSDKAPAWADMVHRGILLRAAYGSGALAGLYKADEVVEHALLEGVVGPVDCGPLAEPHVVANYTALVLAEQAAPVRAPISESWIRHVHAVACAPQVTHPVVGDHGVHDHVLGHGDYKHHPNDVRAASGEWRVLAPVADVVSETNRFLVALASDDFAQLTPAAQASYSLYGVCHVAPFAAGNGRVARAVASIPLFVSASIPLLVPSPRSDLCWQALHAAERGDAAALVSFVEASCVELMTLVASVFTAPASSAATRALDRWRARVEGAHRLQSSLRMAVDQALERHRGRSDLGWISPLTDAHFVGTESQSDDPRYELDPARIRLALPGGQVIDEVLIVDAHPVWGNGDVVVLRAEKAELSLKVGPGELAPTMSNELRGRLDALLNRSVTALAVRVASEVDD